MIDLQRSSAGSGKTFTLAKTYLKIMLGRPRKERGEGSISLGGAESWRLRTDREIRDAHSHILAITFTNKATNEMKERIVTSLAELADKERCENSPYLKEFKNIFDATKGEINHTAMLALKELLIHYNDFQVSTIDSFFQTILRTFTYETEQPDNYGVEIDSETVLQEALDAFFTEMRGSKPDNMSLDLIKSIMSEAASRGSRWDVMGSGRNSASALMEYLKLMDKESFKKERARMEDYFNRTRNMGSAAKAIEKECYVILQRHQEKVGKMTAEIRERLSQAGEKDVKKGYLSFLDKVEKYTPWNMSVESIASGNSVFSSRTKLPQSFTDEVDGMAHGLMKELLAWANSLYEAQQLKKNMPLLGVLKMVLEKLEAFHRENNIVQLSDVNTLLSKIINEDDTPFIYERMGNTLENFLIDEFQDTSAMQWDIMKPLVSESVSKGHPNLIIGDAKQSIYRFRNADFSLITNKVPADFSASINIKGERPEENTNWRSSADVVAFNNLIFPVLSEMILETAAPEVKALKQLYAVSQQYIAAKNRNRRGFVKIFKINANDREKIYEGLPLLIAGLLERGYRQSEVAVLINRNDQGPLVIDALMKYNDAHPSLPPVNFVSAESLRVDMSPVVRTVVSLMQEIAAGTTEQRDDSGKTGDDSDDEKKRGYTFVNAEVFNRMLNKRMGKSGGFDGGNLERLIEEILAGMKAPSTPDMETAAGKDLSLPALVEKILASGVIPAPLLKREAPYVSAFMDNLVSYCERYPAGLSGFLKWWEENSDSITVAIPEGMDAVNILTIHKSKGLEYRCVIVPDLAFSYNKNEDIWIDTELFISDNPESLMGKLDRDLLPPLISVGSRPPKDPTCAKDSDPSEGDALDMPQFALLDGMRRAEAINKAYVAFTRGVDELYVYACIPEKATNIAGDMLKILDGDAGIPLSQLESVPECYDPNNGATSPHDGLAAQAVEATGCEEPDEGAGGEEAAEAEGCGSEAFTFGSLPARDCVEKGRKKEDEENKPELRDLDFNSNEPAFTLKYTTEVTEPLGTPEESDERFNEEDTRQPGIRLHSIMRKLRTRSTLERDLLQSLRREAAHGYISPTDITDWKERILDWINVDFAGQFFNDEATVITERQLLLPGKDEKSRRPDRILIYPGGAMVVVDYKFGNTQNPKYCKDMRLYMSLLRKATGCGNIKGYVWYVRLKELVPVS